MFVRNLVSQHRRIICCLNSTFRTFTSPAPTHLTLPFNPPNAERYDCLISRYRNSCCQNDAKDLHLQLVKSGFASDWFLCNTLINIYVRIGKMGAAHDLFDEMPERNSVTWACLISGCTQSEMPDEACALFKEMISAGIFPNHYAIGSALRACQELGSYGFRLGLQIHGLILKSRHAFDMVVCNALISLYGSFMDSATYAYRAFREIEGKNSIAWNSIISAYSKRGEPVTAFELFSNMQQECSGRSFRPSEYTFGSLITVASSSIDCLSLLEQLLAKIKKFGYLHDLYVGSALVSAFARSGSLDTAKKFFEQMPLRNVVSMNGLMVGLVRQKRGEEAAEVFVKMKDLVKINIDSYMVLLSAFAEFSLPGEGRRKGREIHAHAIRIGLSDSKVALGNCLINMYAKCGAIDDACSVFELMNDKEPVTWNSMIAGFDQNECFKDAVITFCAMRRTLLMSSKFSLISALSSCASLGWMRMGEQIHSEGLKMGLDLDVSVSNALLALYAETGCIVECKKVFSLMPKYDRISWNSIIGAFADSESSISDAVGYFVEMMRAGWSLNNVTLLNILAAVSSVSLCELLRQIHVLVLKYRVMDDTGMENALLSCYGKCREIDICESIFSRMGERRDNASWNSMISGYIHNELLHKAMDLVWLMLQNGQRLDCFTFATVLSACASASHGPWEPISKDMRSASQANYQQQSRSCGGFASASHARKSNLYAPASNP
ncbi:hypothetical protein RJ639_046347 [Escallonia herrerae]|uniref:Pentatricopeptide repeat-containing protein n=1 Tax=Escallonia herrerae TaxID=1293975 RepID=A0AA89B2C6_9ASTE|nr:hypothetical protein RJ639_046347 [Escallonia herrerae]